MPNVIILAVLSQAWDLICKWEFETLQSCKQDLVRPLHLHRLPDFCWPFSGVYTGSLMYFVFRLPLEDLKLKSLALSQSPTLV